ncbi:hypothetical protein IJG14_04950 [bacterium]|nr:hypothetical protein [bacterium]
MSKKTTDILKKINKKIDEFITDKEISESLKSEIKELSEMNSPQELTEQFELINTKLDLLEDKNMSLKDSIYDFVNSATKTLETFTKTENISGEEQALKLNDILKSFEDKIDKYFKNKKSDNLNFVDNNEQINKLKDDLSYFQNELENSIKDNIVELSELITTIVSEIRERISDLQETAEQKSEKFLTEIISDVKQLKSDIAELYDSVKVIDNQAIFETEKNIKKVLVQNEEYNKNIISEIQEVKSITAKSAILDAKSKEAVEVFKNELNQLKINIHTQIREVLSKIVIQDEIKFLCEEAIAGIKNNGSETGVLRKYLKDLKNEDEHQIELINEIRNIILDLSDFEMNDSSDKIDIIYENMSMLNNWADSSDKMLKNFDGVNDNFESIETSFNELREDFNFNSDKIDIIYENLTFINEWVKKLDKFAKDVESIKAGYDAEAKIPEKIEEINANIALVKEWNKKADALALQVRALSVQISETESTINSKNLADMKALFAQMTEDMSNLSSRTNKMILDTDKTNDKMQNHLQNLQTIINSLDKKANDLGFEDIKEKINDIKEISTKSSDFGQGLTESFIYLAEWIDYAGNTINSIKSEIDNLKEQQTNNTIQTTDLVNQQNLFFTQIHSLLAEQQKTKEENQQADIIEILKENKEQYNNSIQRILENIGLQIAQIREQNSNEIQQILKNQQLENTQNKEQNLELIQQILENQKVQIKQIEEQNVLKIQEIFENQKIQKNLQDENQSPLNIQQFIENNTLQIQQMKTQNDFAFQQIAAQQALNQQLLQDIKDNQLENTEIIDGKQIDFSEISDGLQKVVNLIEHNEVENKNKITELLQDTTAAVQQQSDNAEIKNLLDFIAAQVVNMNENSSKTEVLSKKIDILENKISNLEQYMARLIDYLDED